MDDLIRRADVLALAKDVTLKNGAKHRCMDATLVYEISSAEPVRKAKWEDRYNDGDWHCTACGAIVEKEEQTRHNWYYFYHCGAKMDGGAN